MLDAITRLQTALNKNNFGETASESESLPHESDDGLATETPSPSDTLKFLMSLTKVRYGERERTVVKKLLQREGGSGVSTLLSAPFEEVKGHFKSMASKDLDRISELQNQLQQDPDNEVLLAIFNLVSVLEQDAVVKKCLVRSIECSRLSLSDFNFMMGALNELKELMKRLQVFRGERRRIVCRGPPSEGNHSANSSDNGDGESEISESADSVDTVESGLGESDVLSKLQEVSTQTAAATLANSTGLGDGEGNGEGNGEGRTEGSAVENYFHDAITRLETALTAATASLPPQSWVEQQFLDDASKTLELLMSLTKVSHGEKERSPFVKEFLQREGGSGISKLLLGSEEEGLLIWGFQEGSYFSWEMYESLRVSSLRKIAFDELFQIARFQAPLVKLIRQLRQDAKDEVLLAIFNLVSVLEQDNHSAVVSKKCLVSKIEGHVLMDALSQFKEEQRRFPEGPGSEDEYYYTRRELQLSLMNPSDSSGGGSFDRLRKFSEYLELMCDCEFLQAQRKVDNARLESVKFLDNASGAAAVTEEPSEKSENKLNLRMIFSHDQRLLSNKLPIDSSAGSISSRRLVSIWNVEMEKSMPIADQGEYEGSKFYFSRFLTPVHLLRDVGIGSDEIKSVKVLDDVVVTQRTDGETKVFRLNNFADISDNPKASSCIEFNEEHTVSTILSDPHTATGYRPPISFPTVQAPYVQTLATTIKSESERYKISEIGMSNEFKGGKCRILMLSKCAARAELWGIREVEKPEGESCGKFEVLMTFPPSGGDPSGYLTSVQFAGTNSEYVITTSSKNVINVWSREAEPQLVRKLDLGKSQIQGEEGWNGYGKKWCVKVVG